MAWLLSPLSWLLLALALAPLAWCLRVRRPWLIVACGLLAAIAVVAMTPLTANALGRLLARSVSAPQRVRRIAAIRGRGAGRRRGWDTAQPDRLCRTEPGQPASRRSRGGVVARRRGPHIGDGRGASTPWHCVRGGTDGCVCPDAWRTARPVRLETHSRDTWGNARNTARLQPHLSPIAVRGAGPASCGRWRKRRSGSRRSDRMCQAGAARRSVQIDSCYRTSAATSVTSTIGRAYIASRAAWKALFLANPCSTS